MVFTSSDDENTRGHAANERRNAEPRSSTEARSSVGSAIVKGVKNSFDEYLLKTLREVSWGVSVDEVTDDFMLEQINAITDSCQNQVLPPPVNELFQKEVRMDMNNMDITSRVTNYFMPYNTLIKKYCFTSFFEEENGSKKKCKLIVNSLPATLKENVKNEIDYRFPEAQSNVMKFYKLICQQALEEAIEHRALSRERN
ncbi:unnamed protein product [Phytophthora fragariaefolia]|uniref:Unnamed protein product n=1 Tax=Phytophthora fragariaefolia TaxID=1490495 RepID=A0A9W6TKZ1_9STRA|nr:unnamed protein product [Phytophthora fragariaefolia]